MNYYNEIKKELVNNEIYKKVKDYSKNRSDLMTYYNVGKLLIEAQGGEERAKYGDRLIKEYAKKLVNDVGKIYNERTLRRMRQFYIISENMNWSPIATELTWSHYCELLSIKDINKINYYVKITIKENLSKMQLRNKIKSNEYERLDENTRTKLVNNENTEIKDFIKHPIIIKNRYNYEEISEKLLKQLILEDITSFMKELGTGFSYIDSEYKINVGNRNNYIDLLLFNIEYNCYVVIELKVTELKKEYLGQIEMYMNYIDKNIRNINQDKTIGIIIVKKDNKFVMEYCSDERIYRTTYELV